MHYPAWKYILIAVVLAIAGLYALPNLYPDEPAVQITGASAGTELTSDVLVQSQALLDKAGLAYHDGSFANNSALIRLNTAEDQLKAQETLRQNLGENYVVALNLAQTTPQWLKSIGAKPMKLGLDLRGGVRFVLEVDMDKALEQRLTVATQEVRRNLRTAKIAIKSLRTTQNGMVLTFNSNDERNLAQNVLQGSMMDFVLKPLASNDGAVLELSYTEQALNQINEYAVGQNLTTLRNRINELGVAEALVQSQGTNRIVVELPGVQDTAEAKRVLGRTANLEFRMVSEDTHHFTGGIAPAGSEAFAFGTLDGPPILLDRQAIVTGDKVQNAQSGVDENGRPQVSITLDTAGGRLMQNATRTSVGKQMAVLFIENKQRVGYEIDSATGETKKEVRQPYSEARVINRATIQAVLGSSFVITGLDSPAEASELALLLRSGALAAPMYFVEERTIGPSLGQDNIDKGLNASKIGYLLVFLWMIVFYRACGVIANIALAFNIIALAAVMSIIGSSLTLPGIAGIVLTMGMAVDANVLIFERIREELAGGAKPKSAIVTGFDRAFSSIFDGNLTTLLVAFILFAIGTGPIKGFAITLAVGIITSLFTAIIVTRALMQIWYGNRKNLTKISIG